MTTWLLRLSQISKRMRQANRVLPNKLSQSSSRPSHHLMRWKTQQKKTKRNRKASRMLMTWTNPWSSHLARSRLQQARRGSPNGNATPSPILTSWHPGIRIISQWAQALWTNYYSSNLHSNRLNHKKCSLKRRQSCLWSRLMAKYPKCPHVRKIRIRRALTTPLTQNFPTSKNSANCLTKGATKIFC